MTGLCINRSFQAVATVHTELFCARKTAENDFFDHGRLIITVDRFGILDRGIVADFILDLNRVSRVVVRNYKRTCIGIIFARFCRYSDIQNICCILLCDDKGICVVEIKTGECFSVKLIMMYLDLEG